MKSQVSVNEQHWSVMYQPMFDKLLAVGQVFSGQEYALYRLACNELPTLIRYSKKNVTRDSSEQPLKIYLTALSYVSLLIISAFRRYEVVSVNEKQQRFSVYPWHEIPSSKDLRVTKRKVVTSSAPFAGEVIHWLVSEHSIWRWMYNEPTWLEKLYREVISGSDAGVLLGQGVVYFDNPFQKLQTEPDPIADVNGDSSGNTPPETSSDYDNSVFDDEPSPDAPDEGLLLDNAPDKEMDLDQLIAEETQNNSAETTETTPKEEEEREGVDVAHEFEKFMSGRGS